MSSQQDYDACKEGASAFQFAALKEE